MALQVEMVPIAALVEDPENARRHPEENLKAIRDSLESFGQVEPLVVQKSRMRVIGGNGRLSVMKELGWEEASCALLDISDSKAKALGVMLNRSGEMAEWDFTRLADTLQELDSGEFPDLSALVGFDPKELEQIASWTPKPEAKEETAPIPELPEKPVTEPGDLWELGPHHVLCGDSSKPEAIAKLMNGEKAGVVATDPPYSSGGLHKGERSRGVSEKYQQSEVDYVEFSGDNRDQRSFTQWASFWLSLMREHSREEAYLFVFSDWRQVPSVSDAIQMAGWLWRGVNVWDKTEGARMASQAYFRAQAEFVLWATNGKLTPRYQEGGPSFAGVFSCAVDGEKIHLTQKPVKVMSWLLGISSGVVLDPFLGSGSTLIAAEGLGRTCYAAEVHPHYVDVAVKRWQNLTGKKARNLTREGVAVE